jgi:hypothetical protein
VKKVLVAALVFTMAASLCLPSATGTVTVVGKAVPATQVFNW